MSGVRGCTLGAEGDPIGAAEPVHGQFVQWTGREGTTQEGNQLMFPQEDSCTVGLTGMKQIL